MLYIVLAQDFEDKATNGHRLSSTDSLQISVVIMPKCTAESSSSAIVSDPAGESYKSEANLCQGNCLILFSFRW